MDIDLGDDPLANDPDPEKFAEMVRGRWVSSFTGFMQDDPAQLLADANLQDPPPPQLAAFRLASQPPAPPSYDQVDGYYPLAGLVDVRFGFNNSASGPIEWKIGPGHHIPFTISGSYFVRHNNLGYFDGNFAWELACDGYNPIRVTGYFVITSRLELNWMITGASRTSSPGFPRVIGGGIMHRVPIIGPI